MSSNLVARIENTILNAGSSTTFVFDWPGGSGVVYAEGLNLVGSSSLGIAGLLDTFGQIITSVDIVPAITADGAFEFKAPPGRWHWNLSANSGAVSLTKLSIYKV